jgi:hypothetical protein
MSFEDFNREAASAGGNWHKLTKREHGVLKGKIVNVEKRAKQFGGKPVLNSKTQEPRYEWIFTLEDTEGKVIKFAAVETAQYAIRGALGDRKLEPGGFLQIAVVEDAVAGSKSAEYKAKYESPVKTEDPWADAPPANNHGFSEEPPF